MDNQEEIGPAIPKIVSTRLWTEEELRKERNTFRRNNLALAGLGVLLLIGAGAMGSSRDTSCFQGILGIAGFYLVFIRLVIPYIFPPVAKRIYAHPITNRRMAGKIADWYRQVVCINCKQPAKVNIGYLEFDCHYCDFKDNWVRAGEKEDVQNLARTATCASCHKNNDLADHPAWYNCPHCNQKADLFFIPR